MIKLVIAARRRPGMTGEEFSHYAKDMGIFNVANSLPQPLAPAIAPIFLAIPFLAAAGEEGTNYRMLFLISALFALASALVIRRVRGVR